VPADAGDGPQTELEALTLVAADDDDTDLSRQCDSPA